MSNDNFNLNDLMKNAQEMLGKAQERLTKITVVGEAGAGLVKVEVNAKHEVLKLTLADELMQESKDIIEDLIRAAINDANRKIIKATQENIMSLGDFMQAGQKPKE